SVCVVEQQVLDSMAIGARDSPADPAFGADRLNADHVFEQERDRSEAGPTGEVLTAQPLIVPTRPRLGALGRIALPQGRVLAVALLGRDPRLVRRLGEDLIQER